MIESNAITPASDTPKQNCQVKITIKIVRNSQDTNGLSSFKGS